MISMHVSERLKELNEENSQYILGVLASEDDHIPNAGEKTTPVTAEKNLSNIRFYIKPLSDEPDVIYELDDFYKQQNLSTLYHGYKNNIESYIPDMEYRHSDIDGKKEIVEKILSNKVILFKPKIVKEDKVFKNIEAVILEGHIEIDNNTTFTAIPIVNMTVEDFENKLFTGEDLVLNDYSNQMILPDYVICKDNVRGYYLYGNLGTWKDGKNKSSLNHIYSNQISRIKIDVTSKEFKGNIVNATDHLLFLKNNMIENIGKKLEENKIELSEKVLKEEPLNTDSEEKDNINIDDTKESEFNHNNESDFIKYFVGRLKKEGLCYSEEDIVNFHTSIKTNFLTILSGMSGTGKTQLAMAYGQSLGLSTGEENLLIVPVKPSYTEPEDVLGYLNISNGLYTSSDTGLVELLKRAQDKPNEMHIVIFDEMNLSQVEYWFAPFISLLEIKEDEDRKLNLYNGKSSVCHNAERYPSQIKIGDNIRFIGTVNVDETVKDFSDRVLDRANVVTLTKQSFDKYRIQQKDENMNTSILDRYNNDNLKKEYKFWIKSGQSINTYKDNEIKFFDDLHDLISIYDSSKGVSFRTLERIGDYLNNIPEISCNIEISRGTAIDIQIRQRLLTKLNGSREQFVNLIGSINDESEIMGSELYEFFDSQASKDISEFNRTKDEIKKKARELSLYGYTN